MGLTKAERYNRNLHKIFDEYRDIKKKESGMSYKELIADGYSKETAKHIAIEKKLKRIAGF